MRICEFAERLTAGHENQKQNKAPCSQNFFTRINLLKTTTFDSSK